MGGLMPGCLTGSVSALGHPHRCRQLRDEPVLRLPPLPHRGWARRRLHPRLRQEDGAQRMVIGLRLPLPLPDRASPQSQLGTPRRATSPSVWRSTASHQPWMGCLEHRFGGREVPARRCPPGLHSHLNIEKATASRVELKNSQEDGVRDTRGCCAALGHMHCHGFSGHCPSALG